MFFYSTTFDDKDRALEINAVLGRRFSVFKNLMMGGSGSSRMLVQEVSPALQVVMSKITNVNYTSIEIRPQGIIVHFVQQGLKSWCWLIPFGDLYIEHANGLIISDRDNFIKIKNDRFLQSNENFIQKVISQQSAFN